MTFVTSQRKLFLRPLVLAHLLLVVSCCACADQHRFNGREGNDVVERLETLERIIRDEHIMHAADLGCMSAYGLEDELARLVREIARSSKAEEVIERLYGDEGSDRIVKASVELVFPLLDILMRVSESTGRDTKASREKLWRCWTEACKRVPVPESGMYRLGLEGYENEIRISKVK